MAILKNGSRDSYTVIDNSTIRDSRLSAKAKGIHAVLLSLPNDWSFNQKGLQQFMTDGIDAIRTGLDELEEAGYLKRERARSDDGTYGEMLWIVLEKPILENPIQVMPIQENRQLQSKEEQSNDLQSNYSINTPKRESGKEPKHRYGEFDNVLLTDKELESLKERFPHDWMRRIDDLSYYIGSKGRSYKSHYKTILAWDRSRKQSASSRQEVANEFAVYN